MKSIVICKKCEKFYEDAITAEKNGSSKEFWSMNIFQCSNNNCNDYGLYPTWNNSLRKWWEPTWIGVQTNV